MAFCMDDQTLTLREVAAYLKLAAKDLIVRLLQSHPKVLVQDWWKDGQTQRQVRAVIEDVLDKDLPTATDESSLKKNATGFTT